MPEASSRTLVLLRHGRTAWNHALRVQGQLDVELDDVGREQAATAARALAKLTPSLLWSSDLVRARVTADAVAEATGLRATYDERLREFHLGERQGLTHDEYAALDPAGFAQFRSGRYDAAPGAEPTGDVRRRMSAVLGELLAALGPGETGVAVSHGAAIRVATGAMLGWPEEQFHSLRGVDNCGWVVLEEHPEAGALRLGAYNRIG
ncbi:histidine phosphatase family protein [Nocardioides sp. cx-173]|uniref:histidine phosphatase family protein n=1 Tax=Nocardioides sp. cx-173 TaxID=2898796 RepID=UPI001E307308|nr:histidine phosphatase family protein [Nocardioides sp. cx-173]MCD4526262.1 histidine phosphatase family protein [Nocardioides sp. cx-173]UGB40529.1 histidine phosphatase family protein [Nocardioides sp. cx-173]